MFNHTDRHVTPAATAGGWGAFVGIPIYSWIKFWTKTPLLSFGIKPQLSKTGRNALIDCSGKYCRTTFLPVPDVKTALLPRAGEGFSVLLLFTSPFLSVDQVWSIHHSISKLFFSACRLFKLCGNWKTNNLLNQISWPEGTCYRLWESMNTPKPPFDI